jgi:Ca-activated chloride channel family protein
MAYQGIRMRDGILAVLLATLAGAAASAQELQSAPFKAGTTVVPVTVSVERADGSYVAGIDPSRFRLMDEGVPRDITLFDDGNVPMDLLLLLDISSSMTARLPTMKQAVGRLLTALRPRDRAALLAFGTRTTVVQPFTHESRQLKRALDTLSCDGSTSLYDALYVALHEFHDPEPQIRRRAVVVFSDGDDTASLMSFDGVLDAARRRDVATYTVRMLSPFDKVDRFARDAFELREMARETGGRAFTSQGVDELAVAYESIAREVAHQYVLGFVLPHDSRAGFHRVTVTVDLPRARVHARSGYIAPD